MSTILEAMKERRSIRKFKPDMPARDAIEKVMEAGLYAASGMGKQSPVIVAVTDRKLRDKLSDQNRRIMNGPEGADPFYGAPVVLIVLADKSARTCVYDGSLALGNMMLAAHALGLGSCWIHRAKEEFESEEGKALLKSLGIEGDYEGVGHCILGYADGELPEAKARRAGRTFWVE